MSGWAFGVLPAACLGIALLELDGVLVGQWMISRAIIVGPIVGSICGDPASGLTFGVLFELLTLAVPSGGGMTLNGAVAAGGGVLLAAGPLAMPLSAAFPLAMGLGAGHRRIESHLRTRRSRLGLEAAADLGAEGRVDWESIVFKSAAAQAAATFAWLYVSVGLAAPWAARILAEGPAFLREGLEIAFGWTPWIALAVLIGALARRR